MCFIMLPIPFVIMTIAPKYTPAYQVYLIFLLESVLGTTWVWVIINEVPSLNTIIGGLLLLTSVLIYMILESLNPTSLLLLSWIKEFKVHYVCLLTECSANSILTRSIKKDSNLV